MGKDNLQKRSHETNNELMKLILTIQTYANANFIYTHIQNSVEYSNNHFFFKLNAVIQQHNLMCLK